MNLLALSVRKIWLQISLVSVMAGSSIAYAESLVIGHSMLPDSLAMQRAQNLAHHVKSQTGINIKLKYLPAKRSLTFANQGVIDGDFARSIELQYNTEYEALRIVNTSWVTSHLEVISKNDVELGIGLWDSLSSFDLCSFRGSVYVDERIKAHGLSAIPTNTTDQALRMVANQRCDIAILWKEQLTNNDLAYMKKENLIFKKTLAALDGYIYLNRKKSHLIDAIQRSIEGFD